MKKILMLAAALAAAAPAWAEWTRYGFHESAGTFYLDAATVKIVGNARRVWVLNDFAKTDKEGDRSVKTFYEIDCSETRLRVLQPSYYNESMGEGTPTSTYGPSSWKYAAPETIGESLIEKTCRRR